MALHMLRSTPTFTKAMRGYDPDEVDDHLAELQREQAEGAEALAEAEARAAALGDEVERLRARVCGLEASIRAESPRSIAALGERLGIVLGEAEEGAEEALRAAREEADTILSTARRQATEVSARAADILADAEQRAAGRIALADERAGALEADATRRADALVRDTEERALARRKEIEDWVLRVRAHIEAEEARAADEFARVRAARVGDLDAIGRRRDAVISSLESVATAARQAAEAARADTGADTGAEAPLVAAADAAPPAAVGQPEDPDVTVATPALVPYDADEDRSGGWACP